MKELEKTKRISISAVLFILAVVIGFLSFEKPKNVFSKDINLTLDHISKKDYLIYKTYLDTISSLNDISFIDIRSPFEFNKGHLKNAINIYAPNLLKEENKSLLKELENKNKTIVLYGDTPNNVNGSWMLLNQMGFNNIKMLCAKTHFVDNEFIIENYPLEKPSINFAEFMKEANSNKIGVVKKQPKKVIQLKKKKKKTAEGGC
jgi:rhodanese-related sulfurtransferase